MDDDSNKNKQGVLKKEMIFQKTRTQNLADVRTLNMWGYGLEDISIARNLVNAETISFPINKIQTLAPFQTCRNLHNLLLRQNLISDINEIQYLTGLPNLKNLTLAENPIASLPGYRETIISILPQLEKLDEIDISIVQPQSSKIQKSFKPQQQSIQKKKQFFNDNDFNDDFQFFDNNNINNNQNSNKKFLNNEITPSKKHFNILEKIDNNQIQQQKIEINQPKTNYSQTFNPPPQQPNRKAPTNALDEHLLTAVLSLIPELSVESLQIVLEAIRDRCK